MLSLYKGISFANELKQGYYFCVLDPNFCSKIDKTEAVPFFFYSGGLFWITYLNGDDTLRSQKHLSRQKKELKN